MTHDLKFGPRFHKDIRLSSDIRLCVCRNTCRDGKPSQYFLIDLDLIIPESTVAVELRSWLYWESFKERMFRWRKG
jgi:hypothetical protein